MCDTYIVVDMSSNTNQLVQWFRPARRRISPRSKNGFLHRYRNPKC